jgi:signal peptidase I
MTRSGRLGPTGPPPPWEDRPDRPRGQEQPPSRHRAEDADGPGGRPGHGANGQVNGYGEAGYGAAGRGYERDGQQAEGYGANGYGPDADGADGYGGNGYGPNGYGPNGHGANGHGRDANGANGYAVNGTNHHGEPNGYGNGNGAGYGQNGYRDPGNPQNGSRPARPDYDLPPQYSAPSSAGHPRGYDDPPQYDPPQYEAPRYEPPRYERPRYEEQRDEPEPPRRDDSYFGQPPAIDVRDYAQRAPEPYGYPRERDPYQQDGYPRQANGYATPEPPHPGAYDNGRANGYAPELPPAYDNGRANGYPPERPAAYENGHTNGYPPQLPAGYENGRANGYAAELPAAYDNGYAARPAALPARQPAETVAGAGVAEATELLHRYVPANEVLDREKRSLTPQRMARTETRRAHPPRAVVRRRRARRRAMEWPFLVAFALVAAFVIRTFAIQTFYIPSGSMHETLLEGDRVLVNKISYHLHSPNRGDVVVFTTPPGLQVDDDDLIKRVVGLPGETVEGHDRKVWVNGKALSEPYVEPKCNGTADFLQVTVPPGDLWVMGDNRCDSSDSRVFGPILQSTIVGRAFTLVWPPGRIAWL